MDIGLDYCAIHFMKYNLQLHENYLAVLSENGLKCIGKKYRFRSACTDCAG